MTDISSQLSTGAEATSDANKNPKGRLRTNRRGKIKIATQSKSTVVIKVTAITLLALTVYGFLTFDYRGINFFEATVDTLRNAMIMFTQPALTHVTFVGLLNALVSTFSMAFLATLFGAVIAFFGSLACAQNIANAKVSLVVRSIAAYIRAVPTILLVLIFVIAAGQLGSVPAVAALTLAAASYLVKAYSESIEEMDYGCIEALKASGAGYWQIVFQAIVPASISYLIAWTFLRLEISFTQAIIFGAAAGAGGIGYYLFMAGNFYFDLRELGFITLVCAVAAILLEMVATRVKAHAK